MNGVFKFNLRDEVKDTITGFAGVVTGRIEFLNGCIRYIVQTRKRTTEGKVVDDTIDEQQLVYLHPPKVPKPPKVKKDKKPGGPFNTPGKFSASSIKKF